jgi:uncharacterized membrane protein HdeD (DUF308 family)
VRATIRPQEQERKKEGMPMLRTIDAPGGTAARTRSPTPPAIARHWRRWFVLGLLSSLVGAAAFAAAAVPAGYAMTLIAALLAAESALQFARAALLPQYAGAGWHPLAGILAAVAAGALMLESRGIVLPPALVLGLFLLISGVGKSFLGVMLEPMRGCYWLFAAGTVPATLGVVLLLLPQVPGASLLGAALGTGLLLEGAWSLRVARSARYGGIDALLPRSL